MKNTIKLNESELKSLISESINRFLNESNMGYYTFDCTVGVWCGKGGFNSGNLMNALKKSGKFRKVNYCEEMVSADFSLNIDLSDLDIQFSSVDDDEFDDYDDYSEFEEEVLERAYSEAEKVLKPIFGKMIKYFHNDGKIDLYGVHCNEIGFNWGQKMIG